MKKKIAVVAGGYSGEYEISVKSAAMVCATLDSRRWEPYLIRITRDAWVYVSNAGREFPVDKNDFSVRFPSGRLHFDAVFIAIHGTPGEDGKLQGYFDMLGVPYTSCSQGVSSLTFNKYFCNAAVSALGVRTARNMILYKGQPVNEKEVLDALGLPCFIKPNNGGSSVGMSKVKKAEELGAALRKAFREDEEVLAEQFIEGREITCGLMKSKGSMIVFPITEIVSQTEFFDFEAKYHGRSEEITPAPVDESIEIKCKATSAIIYQKLNCKGVVRMDYIIGKDGLYFLEVNTVPGMTDVSIVPQQAAAFGMKTRELFSRLLDEALTGSRKRK